MRESIAATKEAAALLCLSDQVPTMLAMWVRESDFDPKADDQVLVGFKKRSLGVAQTRQSYIRDLREDWMKQGVRLGAFALPRTQVFLGVMEFRYKLKVSKGNVAEAVRRYNGSGPKARKYVERVSRTRLKIFGSPLGKSERGNFGGCP